MRSFWVCEELFSGEMVRRINSICLNPKWHFSTVSFNPGFWMHSKKRQTFQVRSVILLETFWISAMYWALWSNLTFVSKCWVMKLENAKKITTKAFSKFFVGKTSAGENGRKTFHSPLVYHMQTVICLGPFELAEDGLPARCFVPSDEALTGWILLV